MLFFFPGDVLDEILDLIESVSGGGVPTYFCITKIRPLFSSHFFIKNSQMLNPVVTASFAVPTTNDALSAWNYNVG